MLHQALGVPWQLSDAMLRPPERSKTHVFDVRNVQAEGKELHHLPSQVYFQENGSGSGVHCVHPPQKNVLNSTPLATHTCPTTPNQPQACILWLESLVELRNVSFLLRTTQLAREFICNTGACQVTPPLFVDAC